MIDVGNIEDELNLLKIKYKCEYGSYEYYPTEPNKKTCTTEHFNQLKRKEKYGVYIIRQKDTKEILYIGKGGTIKSDGFAPQDLPKRLNAPRNENLNAREWFMGFKDKSPDLLIEYIFLPIEKSPAFVEAALLQAYFNEFKRLPYKNKSL